VAAVTLHPQQASHRSSRIATDLSIQLAMSLDTLSQFISKEEMFHLEMQMLYVMIDLMGATHGSDPENVIEMCKGYFAKLKRERNGNVY
jgi:hypothetical protein